jgi:hypothetical protein
MRIHIDEHRDSFRDAIGAFNARLAAGGSAVRFPASPPAARPGISTTCYLTVDEGAAVRGGYFLKAQEFLLAGRTETIADIQLPVSEGVVNRAYAQIAAIMLVDAQQRQPLLYGLGMGGREEPVARLLRSAGWEMFSVPFYFHIVHPFRFLRNITYVRRSPLRRCVLDTLAFSGLGWLGTLGLRACYRSRVEKQSSVSAELVDDFGDWADVLWTDHKSHYGLCAVRDGEVLRSLYPKDAPSFLRLKVMNGSRPLGWALLMNTQLSGHKQFGNMRLGSIVDCFAAPADAAIVIHEARAALQTAGVDLIASNQSHRAWRAALKTSGFISGPSNFLFASSKALSRRLVDAGVRADDIHVNRGDGDGPINL